MTEINISTHQDYLDITKAVELPEIDESLCQVCGAVLKPYSENVGFDDNPKIEVWYECSNGCIQSDNPLVEVWYECPNGCDQDEGLASLSGRKKI